MSLIQRRLNFTTFDVSSCTSISFLCVDVIIHACLNLNNLLNSLNKRGPGRLAASSQWQVGSQHTQMYLTAQVGCVMRT